MLLLVCMCTPPAAADEGMWLFQQFPKDAVQQKYGFEATRQFLDHLRLASVRIGGGSGAFVLPKGLLITGRHLVPGCIAGQDSFYASAASGEARCPGLDASVLVQIDDVTKQVKAAAREGATAAKALEARNAAIARIESECAAGSANTCSVVTLFSGGRYDLHRYRKYTDVRLVFAPEYALVFFGRERDSLTYLRYGLDIAFLRAYENGKPAATPDYLKWSTAGAKDGELVFASGNPATTVRATTAAQLTFFRDTALPVALARLTPRIQQLNAFAAKSENDRRAAQPVLTAFLESYKSAAGKLIGLRDDRLVSRKTIFDAKIRQAVENDPKLGKPAGQVWDQVAAAYKTWAPFERPYQVLEASPAPGSELFRIAELVRGRSAQGAHGPIHDALEAILLTQYLEELKNLKGRDAPVKAILSGQTPEQAAEELVKSTTLKNAAVMNPDDPMIRLAQLLDAPGKRLRKKREDLIGSLETSAAEKIAQYRYVLFGDAEYPDATSTPRVEFGTVKGYTDRAGTPQPYAATLGGLFYRRTNEGPYGAPSRWLESQPMLNLTTPLDFVSTCDIGGGDSGSPTVNRTGELVGVIFDGNLESLQNTYLYVEDQARAVHVAAQGIVEALEKVYHATPLLEELGVRAGAPSGL
ncbi:MAG TPA: S46 family peptidase [Bryobacteraceae bacterium]|nr:S46 family peptidase [Bryobacteraceae bacterium]